MLVVDDDASLVKMLKVRLNAEGFETELAVDGKTAVALAETCSPSIILLDIAMPGVSGIDVLERLQGSDNGKTIPVIIMTAYPHMIELVRDNPSVVECLVKPFDLPKMVKRIKEVVGEEA